MPRVTPPLNSRGLFILRLPFAASATTVYHVSAQRLFDEIIASKLDPVKLIYEPVGLGDPEYQADIAAGAAIITLISDTGKTMYVPDTYIESYPDMGTVPHSWVVCGISCGMLPDIYDTTALTTAVKEAVSNYTGIQSTVTINRAPVTDAITQTQFVQNTMARNAAITNQSTTYADNLQYAAQVAALKDANAKLIEMVEALQAQLAAVH